MPAKTVISPPPTAASKIATPSGRLQRQPKNANWAEAVFWAMNISNRMRIRKPTISADYTAAARVNLTGGSSGALPGTEPGTVVPLSG